MLGDGRILRVSGGSSGRKVFVLWSGLSRRRAHLRVRGHPFVAEVALGALLLSAGNSAFSQDPAELTTQENQPTFKMEVQRNLVIVRVVVRDQKGNAVGTLGQDDFRLFDNGKPQTILHFSVESNAPK